MFGATTGVAPLGQQRPQPAGGDHHAGLLREVGAEAGRCPRVEQQAQVARRDSERRLQRRAIGGIGLGRTAAAWGIAEPIAAGLAKALQPVPNPCRRSPTPRGDRGHVLPECHALHHLQPFAQPRRQIAPSQRSLDHRPLGLCPLDHRGPVAVHAAPPALGEASAYLQNLPAPT